MTAAANVVVVPGMVVVMIPTLGGLGNPFDHVRQFALPGPSPSQSAPDARGARQNGGPTSAGFRRIAAAALVRLVGPVRVG